MKSSAQIIRDQIKADREEVQSCLDEMWKAKTEEDAVEIARNMFGYLEEVRRGEQALRDYYKAERADREQAAGGLVTQAQADEFAGAVVDALYRT